MDFSSELKRDSEKKASRKVMEREAAKKRMLHNAKLQATKAKLPATSFADLVKLAGKTPEEKKQIAAAEVR